MINSAIEKILNEQIEKEGYSSNLYLAMASWCENKGFPGISEWFYEQADEERMHMLKFVKYVNERGGHAIVPALEQPPVSYSTVVEVFDQVMEHEQYISGSINDIVAKCIDEKDFTTHSWVQWFVNEQIEEEASVSNIIDKLRLVGDQNMYLFDRDIMAMRKAQAAASGE